MNHSNNDNMDYSNLKNKTIYDFCNDESVINDFLEANLQASDYTVSFSDIDSTRYVSDSIVNIMRAEALKNKMFKKGIKYAGKSKQYIYTRVTICIGNDTTSHTFYLTPDMNQVVSFKAN